MFMANLTYKKPLEEVARYIQTNSDYLLQHYNAANFIASGPQTPALVV